MSETNMVRSKSPWQIGREVFLGSSVSISPGVSVGDGAYIGAGFVVLRNVPPSAKMFGVPARQKE